MTPDQQFRYLGDPVAFAVEVLGFQPDPHQAAILSSDARRGIILCTRQWGKSTITALKAAHMAYFHDKTDVLVAANTARQSGELVRKAQSFLAQLGVKRRGDGLNSISQLLPNGSRIIGLPGEKEANIRGYSAPSLILIDEARFVNDELYYALLPMLATNNGALWLISTAGARHGFFYEQWNNQANGFERFTVTAYDCPRIQRAFIEDQYQSVPAHVFEREYMCVFHGAENALFHEDDLAAAIDPALEPLC